MLSLPLIPPTFDSNPILSTAFRPRPDSPPPPAATASATHNPQHVRQLQQRRDEDRKFHNTRSPLAFLTADEAAIAARKAAIRNFGAYWIRPHGVLKTLQATHEEEAERLEAEEQARQEAGLRDMQARQQALEVQERAGQAAEESAQEGEERNLDDEIPDAPEQTAEMSFNEESMVEGSSLLVEQEQSELLEEEAEVQQAVELEEAELIGAAQDQEELGIERDLDDSVPEAGSYQHTDTEVEDSDSDSELQDSFARQSVRRSARVERSTQAALGVGGGRTFQAQGQAIGGLQERMRAQVGALDSLPRSRGSLHLSSSILESSFVGSSPVMQRGGQAGRGRGRARGRQS
ncbi:hypothetical protein LTS16_009886 [Friedmanniomyces endolithicus]|nr:hypothetical protein LTS16_009886 [Friedmanniomyces endolithicus]